MAKKARVCNVSIQWVIWPRRWRASAGNGGLVARRCRSRCFISWGLAFTRGPAPANNLAGRIRRRVSGGDGGCLAITPPVVARIFLAACLVLLGTALAQFQDYYYPPQHIGSFATEAPMPRNWNFPFKRRPRLRRRMCRFARWGRGNMLWLPFAPSKLTGNGGRPAAAMRC